MCITIIKFTFMSLYFSKKYFIQIISRYAIVRNMTAAGLGLNKFCYAGLIVAHKNKTPFTNDFDAKVVSVSFS